MKKYKEFLLLICIVIVFFISLYISIAISDLDKVFIIMVGWLFLTLPLYFLSKEDKSRLIVYSSINGIVSGGILSIYYLKNLEASFNYIFFVLVSFIALYIITHLYNKLNEYTIFHNISITVLVVSAVGLFILWTGYDYVYGCELLMLNILLISYTVSKRIFIKKDIFAERIIGFSSMILFGGVLFTIVLIITDGDGFELLSLGPDGDFSKKRKNT